MSTPEPPDDVTAEYANDAARAALDALQSTPDYEHLAAFLLSLRDEHLVVDVTGTPSGTRPRIRTIRSTQGQLILPLFTSLAELRLAVQPDGRRRADDTVTGAVLPAADALALIETDRFVAAQFDAGSAALVILRKYIDLVLSDDAITAEALAEMKDE